MKPTIISSNGAIIDESIDGESIFEIVAGWCKVFHQSTENFTIGRLITPTKTKMDENGQWRIR